ncbi:MAG: cobalamin biosynthesis protein [Deltaproteobacteria bacterium]|jgi:cobalamin biosynthesis protein CbiG|nr:cobalamin biosynthesis protein [Deltaproteobacteria bacterium]
MDFNFQDSFAIYALTGQGAALAGQIMTALQTSGNSQGQIFLSASAFNAQMPGQPSGQAKTSQTAQSFDRLADCLAGNFRAFSCHILICASGIAVRSLAPLLTSKQSDPAVLLLDQRGSFVISLLSGHLGRANPLATKIADLIGGTPVITTATDTEGLPAIDSLAAQHNLRIVNPAAVRSVSASLLRGERPMLYDPHNLLDLQHSKADEYFQFIHDLEELNSDLLSQNLQIPIVLVNTRAPLDPLGYPETDTAHNILLLESREVWLGLGCKRGTDFAKLEAFALSILEEHKMAPDALAGLASLDLKQDEPALLQLAARWRLPIRFFSAAELDEVSVPHPSERVRQAVGSGSVSEAAALLAAGSLHLLMPKRKKDGITAALAKTNP